MKKSPFQICAEEVRETRCSDCLYCAACGIGGFPIPRLARFIAKLELDILPPIQSELNKCFVEGLILEAHAPYSSGVEEDAYAVVRVYTKGNPRKFLCSIGLNGDESAEEIKILIFNAYIRRKGK